MDLGTVYSPSLNVVKNSSDPTLVNEVHRMANREWASRPKDQRFETLDDLTRSVKARRSIAASKVMPLSQISARALSEREIAFSTTRGEAIPTNWGFGQMCRHAGAPAGYLRSLPAPLAAECLNSSIESSVSRGTNVKAYLHLHPETTVLAAATGPKYGRIFDAEVAEMAQRLVEANPQFHNPKEWSGKGSGLFASDHDCFIFLIDGGSMLDVGPRAEMNQGVIFRNSEVGDCTFEAWRFFFNVVCGNLFIWNPSDVSRISIRHTSGGPQRFYQEAWPTMVDLMKSDTEDMTSAVRLAIEHRIPDNLEDWTKMFSAKGFTRTEIGQAYSYAQKEEPSTATLWSAVQGFTALARDMEHADSRFDLAQRAAKLVEGLRN